MSDRLTFTAPAVLADRLPALLPDSTASCGGCYWFRPLKGALFQRGHAPACGRCAADCRPGIGGRLVPACINYRPGKTAPCTGAALLRPNALIAAIAAPAAGLGEAGRGA